MIENSNLSARNKTLIVGCGRLGASIANKFVTEGKSIMVVDKNKDSFDNLSDRFSGYTFVGDITDTVVLENANIRTAKEIVITTGDDNVNIFIAHLARKIYNVPQIYVRLADPDNEVLLRGLDINAIYPFELSYEKFIVLRGRRQ